MGRVGLCTIAFKELAINEVIAIAARTGAEAIEVWGQPPHVAYPLDYRQLEATRLEAERNKLDLAVYGSYFRPGKSEVFDGVAVDAENQIDAARILGARIIRIWPGNDNPGVVGAKAELSIIDDIRRFADAAANAGIETVLERHNNTLTHGWDAPEKLLDRIAHDHVFLNYQIPYPMPEAEYAERSIEDFRKYLPLSRHAHIQNYHQSPSGELERTFLEHGVVDYRELGTAVEDSGFRGYLMIEFSALSSDESGDRTHTELIEAVGTDIDYLDSLLIGTNRRDSS